MCRVPAGSLPAGTYAPPTWLDTLASGTAGALSPVSSSAAISAAAAAAAPAPPAAAPPAAAAAQPLLAAGVALPAISDAELSMLDSLLNANVKTEGPVVVVANAQQQQQPMPAPTAMLQPKPEPVAFAAVASSAAVPAVNIPAPPAFLSGVFSANLPYAGITHTNAAAYGAAATVAAAQDGRGKRAKKVSEERAQLQIFSVFFPFFLLPLGHGFPLAPSNPGAAPLPPPPRFRPFPCTRRRLTSRLCRSASLRRRRGAS